MTSVSWARRGMIGIAVLAIMLTAGCQERTGTVSGKVLLANKPLEGGTVTFAPKEQGRFPRSSTIDAQGSYVVTLPVGEYQIMVDNREPHYEGGPPKMPPGMKLPPEAKESPAKEDGQGKAKQRGAGRYVAIPPRYYSSDTSGLSYTVIAGAQPHDIELTK